MYRTFSKTNEIVYLEKGGSIYVDADGVAWAIGHHTKIVALKTFADISMKYHAIRGVVKWQVISTFTNNYFYIRKPWVYTF
jgi:hypothetical protein